MEAIINDEKFFENSYCIEEWTEMLVKMDVVCLVDRFLKQFPDLSKEDVIEKVKLWVSNLYDRIVRRYGYDIDFDVNLCRVKKKCVSILNQKILLDEISMALDKEGLLKK